jgi:peroxiredoxin Q/BCP
MIEVGKKAPAFTLRDQDGKPVKLSDFRGRKVVLYFYPKDDTSGCTTQACGLQERIAEFDARGAVILGVSPDSPASHTDFRKKYGLDFTLLADEDHAVAGKYGVWQEKSMYGRKYWGIARTTYVIDGEGRVAQVLEKVKPAQHTDQVLELI